MLRKYIIVVIAVTLFGLVYAFLWGWKIPIDGKWTGKQIDVYYSEYCPACDEIKNWMDQVGGDGFVNRINVDESGDMVATPTVVVRVNGWEVDRKIGRGALRLIKESTYHLSKQSGAGNGEAKSIPNKRDWKTYKTWDDGLINKVAGYRDFVPALPERLEHSDLDYTII